MKLKNKTKVLAAAIAFAGMTYLPQVSASTVNLFADDESGFGSSTLAHGAFTDWFDFAVDDVFSLAATGQSLKTSVSKGTELYSLNLYELDHTTLINSGSVSSFSAGSVTAFLATNFATPLLAAHGYSLGVTGFVFSPSKGSYSVSLTTAAAVSGPTVPFVPVAAVPLPGAVWLMLTGIVGLFGYQARNKKTA
ncbi:hypothetical protein [Methylobacter psychrophilus]|uniref:hypothetical protein n=1 Tax=Methylobacter psychrophilus TaxID=96941 RepID=UPI0021D4B8F7|nr:hypothetical protein [Methylobacter psychrophilus]